MTLRHPSITEVHGLGAAGLSRFKVRDGPQGRMHLGHPPGDVQGEESGLRTEPCSISSLDAGELPASDRPNSRTEENEI
jgi:hypothetical protein